MIGQDPLDLGGQVAFVTGAGQGAGRAIALALARHNAGGVAVNDFEPARAEAVAEEIRQMGVPASAAPADVGDHGAVETALSSAGKALGPITILVNNAGIAAPASLEETTLDDFERVVAINLRSNIQCAQAVLPAMKQAGRGRIVSNKHTYF